MFFSFFSQAPFTAHKGEVKAGGLKKAIRQSLHFLYGNELFFDRHPQGLALTLSAGRGLAQRTLKTPFSRIRKDVSQCFLVHFLLLFL